jgi:23S rRNA (pseudouridine1915-N3)-methyltransferase
VKFVFIFPGKTKDKYLRGLLEDYLSRIKRFLPAQIIEIPEKDSSRSSDIGKIIDREGDRIKEHLPDSNFTIAFDENGKDYSTREFASLIEKKLSGGFKQISLVTGGPFGLSKKIKEESEVLVSLSRLTFTHEMSRLIVMEQIFRALTILKGIKYHY